MQKNITINSDDELEYFISYDKEKNQDSTPPLDENIKVQSIWVFEAYTPTNIENFHRGVETLGWGENYGSFNSDFQNQIDDMRYQSSTSGWLNLGFVFDKSQTNLMPGTKKADLPKGISHLRLTILQYLPSTTILSCQFILSDELSCNVEESLRETYKSYREPTKTGYAIHDVVNQKRQSVILTRTYLKDLCSLWIKKNLPGLFSSGKLDGDFPTCELFIFNKYNPFQDELRKPIDNYVSILNMDSDYNTWSCDELENLYMIPSETRNYLDKVNVVLFCNINRALDNKDLSPYGDNKKSQLIGYLSYLDQTLGTWVLSIIARTYDRSLSMLRDSFGQVGDLDSSSSFKNLINLEKKFLEVKGNAIPFALELKEYCKYKKRFLYDVYEFKAVHEMRQKHPPFFEIVRRNLIAFSDHLESGMKSIESTAKTCRQIASVNSQNRLAKTNMSLQITMSWMTLIMLILSFITALSSIDKFKQIFALLKQMFV